MGTARSTFGLTHYWAKSRRGYWVIKRRTAKTRLRRAMRAVWHGAARIGTNRCGPNTRASAARHYQYYGIRGNYRKLEALYQHVERAAVLVEPARGATHHPVGDVCQPA